MVDRDRPGRHSTRVFGVPAAGIDFKLRDQIAYTDHNVPCYHLAVGHWLFLRRQGLSGWFVEKAPDGYTRGEAYPETPNRPDDC